MDGGAPQGGGRKKPRTIIVGAGAAGMALAIKLREAGFTDLAIYEKADEVGGTWRENRYPGVACDVPAHHYNFSFEHNPGWSARLAHGPEILGYLRKVAEKYDLRRDIVFGHEVKHAHFDGRLWHIETDKGRKDSAEFFVAATGPLHVPRLPGLPGLENFRGQSFHTARWPDGLDLRGKKVGVMGTGSSGTQVITALADQGVDLTVFMRSPQWIFPLMNREFGSAELALVKKIPWIGRTAGRFFQWFFEHVFAEAVIHPGWQRKLLQGGCKWNLTRVKDPALREKLTPDFQPMCKRMVMSWEFYPAMARSNVKLVRSGIERIEPTGAVDAAGKLHELDVLVLATGFDTRAYFRPIELANVQGRTLSEAWRERTHAHLSIYVPGFPNFMILGGPHSPRGNFSAIAYSEVIADHIVAAIRTTHERGIATLDARPEAMQKFVEDNQKRLKGTIWVSGCTSWYMDDKGMPETWTGTPDEYRELLRMPRLQEEFDLVRDDAPRVRA